MKSFAKLLSFTASLVGILVVAYFAYMNTALVYIYLPFLGEYNLPGTMAYMISFVGGAVFACLYFLRDSMKKSHQVRSLRKELQKQGKSEEKSVGAIEPKFTSSDNQSDNLSERDDHLPRRTVTAKS